MVLTDPIKLGNGNHYESGAFKIICATSLFISKCGVKTTIIIRQFTQRDKRKPHVTKFFTLSPKSIMSYVTLRTMKVKLLVRIYHIMNLVFGMKIYLLRNLVFGMEIY